MPEFPPRPRRPLRCRAAKAALRLRLVRSALRRAGGAVLLEQAAMFAALGYWPNLRRPRSVNERLAHLKLFERDPRFVTLGDKLAARDYVRERLGESFLARHYAVVARAADLDFAAYPPAFVLKPNHGHGWYQIVPDQARADHAALRAQADTWLHKQFGRQTQEWWYRAMPPRVMVEEWLVDPDHPTPPELKFWCVNGEPRLIVYNYDRSNRFTHTYYAPDWQRLAWSRKWPQGPERAAPPQLPEMLRAARTLAAGLRFVRVDLYALPAGRIAFGELTFAPGSCREPFLPDASWDFRCGRWWTSD